MYTNYYCCVAFILILAQFLPQSAGESLQVNSKNVDEVVRSNELVLLLFYSQRCPFSVQMMPSFDAAADYFGLQYANTGKVTLGKVDCTKEYLMESEYDVGKYPTVKVVRHQQVIRHEYRGQRTTQAIIQFALDELQDPVKEFSSLDDLHNSLIHKYMVIAYFQHKNHADYVTLRKVAGVLKEKCQFHASFAEANALNKITFRRSMDHVDSDSEYIGDYSNFTEMLSWSRERCEPMIRVLTYDNAEELAEEGKPFVMLFHSKDDTKSPKDFANIIQAELMDERERVIFLTADGNRFADPISQMNKSEADLPFIAVDSFVHIFLFPDFRDIYMPGKLKEFIGQLHSGDLHWAHHFEELSKEEEESDQSTTPSQGEVTPTPQHKSKFKVLLPSKKRYTFARDEL